MEDALSTVVLPAKNFTDRVEDEFCSITSPQGARASQGQQGAVQHRRGKRKACCRNRRTWRKLCKSS